jgi:DNA-binding PadR family transcriptional regulator
MGLFGMENRVVENVAASSLGRKLNSLEILLLVFVKYGLTSTYDLISHAGMSAGLTGPALKRMKSAGLLGAKAGPRRVIRYFLTEAGERALHHSLARAKAQNWWLEQNSFFETLPRSMFLSWLLLGFDGMEDWMEFAEDQLRELHDRKNGEAADQASRFMGMKKRFREDPESVPSGFLLAQAYRAMKARSEAAVLIPPSSERFGGYDGLTFEMEELQLVEHQKYRAEDSRLPHSIDEEPD